MKKQFRWFIFALFTLVVLYLAYQYIAPKILGSSVNPSSFSDPFANMTSNQLSTINCDLQIGLVSGGDFFITKKQLCVDAKTRAGDYRACLDDHVPGSCLAEASFKRKEFLCYIDSVKIGRGCANSLFSRFVTGADKHAELSSYKGIEQIGGQKTVSLKDGEYVPHHSDYAYREGVMKKFFNCGGQVTPSCSPHWEESECANYSHLNGSGQEPDKNQWYNIEFKAVDTCLRVGNEMKVTYTYFKLP